jgi:hypothetical protein
MIEKAVNFAWVAGIQEKIKECRGNRAAGYWIMGIGLLFAIFPFFICLSVMVLALLADQPLPGSPPSFQYLVWSLPIGFAAAITEIAVAAYYDHKIKRLMRELDKE